MVFTGASSRDDGGHDVNFADPSRWGEQHTRVPQVRFEASYSGRAIVLRPA